jgi:hypothetical protein
MFTFQLCEDCGQEQSLDCKMLLCKDKDDFAIVCCIVYAINNGLSILGNLEDLQNNQGDSDFLR